MRKGIERTCMCAFLVVSVKSSSFASLCTTAHQALLSMGFSRQEYWSGLSFPPPGDLPDPGIEPRCPALQADSLLSEPPGKPDLSSIHRRSQDLRYD